MYVHSGQERYLGAVVDNLGWGMLSVELLLLLQGSRSTRPRPTEGSLESALSCDHTHTHTIHYATVCHVYSIILYYTSILVHSAIEAADSRQVDFSVNVEEVSSQQVACCWSHNGCSVEDPCGERHRSETQSHDTGVSEQ